jgi:hypothetical protein
MRFAFPPCEKKARDVIAFPKNSFHLEVLKSPFFKGGLTQQFLAVPPFIKWGAGGIIRLPLAEKTFGNCYNN